MVKSFSVLVVILGLIVGGCTYEVTNMSEGNNDSELPQDQPVPANSNTGGILDKTPSRSVLLGDSKIFRPKPAPAGDNIFQQDFGWQQISASDLANPQLITLMPEIFPLDTVGDGSLDGVTWQLVFNFGTGNSLSGDGATINGVFGPVKDENVVDVNLGTSICLPSASFSFKFRQIAYSEVGFNGGVVQASPTVKASLTMGYGNKTNSQRSTATQIFGTTGLLSQPTPMPLANGVGTVFRRPKYANGVSITWKQYSTPGTPSNVSFAASNGGVVSVMSILANVTPPPVIPWPEPAVYAVFTNGTGAPINVVRAQFFLDL